MNKHIQIKSTIALSKTHSKQSGFSLIEVMVAALLLSIGILGVAGLQIIGMKGTQQSHMKQQASAVLHSLTERMHSNKLGVLAANYVDDSETYDCSNKPVCGVGVNCTPADIASLDKHNIFCGFKAGSGPNTSGIKYQAANDVVSLVDGQILISCITDCSDGEMRLEINWQEQAIDDSENNNPDNKPEKDEIVLNTRIAL